MVTDSQPAAAKQAARKATGDKFTRDLFSWLNQVQADHAISAAGFVTVYIISQHINRESGKAWPSQETLYKLARVTRRGLQKIIDKLVERGHLAVEIGGGERLQNAKTATNAYRMVIKEANTSSPHMPLRGEPTFASSDHQGANWEASRGELGSTQEANPSSHKPSEENHLIEPSEGECPPAAGRNRKKAASRLQSETPFPDDLTLDDSMIEIAARNANWHPARAAHEFQKFEANHRAKGRRYRDWTAAWRTWCLKGAEFDRERTQHNGAVIDQAGNPVTAPPNRPPPTWRRPSNMQRAMMGGDDD
ncbi:hypothetical protein [Bradyrhizobium tropiciagri]|uniref:hypothetical protein n=1 Tax=Bradyrhizobium tropiciagri TaxID=312253 RepID=UPI000AC88FD6|nr:hypothetical protein [Bradyrhizobium tropiciagri]